MSFDTVVSLALLVGALFLMMRFGCSAHMGHGHGHSGSNADRSGGAIGPNASKTGSVGLASLNSGNSAPPVQDAAAPPQAKARRNGCC
jgi:hypothetical protein